MKTTLTTDGWKFWGLWGLAFLGFPLGGLAGRALAGPLTTPSAGALGGLATGAVIGAAQWLVLRQRVPLDSAWIAATGGGMAVGLALSVALFGSGTDAATLARSGLLTGALIGLAQYALLQGLSARALVWVPVIAAGWALGWLTTRAAGVDLTPHWTVFGSTGAWVFQLITGLALAWILGDGRTMR